MSEPRPPEGMMRCPMCENWHDPGVYEGGGPSQSQCEMCHGKLYVPLPDPPPDDIWQKSGELTVLGWVRFVFEVIGGCLHSLLALFLLVLMGAAVYVFFFK